MEAGVKPRSPNGRAAARGLDPRLRLQHTFMPAGDASLTTAQVNQKSIDSDHGIYRDLRNVVAKYPFERSHRFAGIQPNSGFGDYSGLSAALGIRSSGVAEQTPALSATTPVSSRLQNGVDSVERLAPITDGPRAKAPRFRLPPFASAMAQTPGAVRVWKRASAREGRPLSDCWSGAGQY